MEIIFTTEFWHQPLNPIHCMIVFFVMAWVFAIFNVVIDKVNGAKYDY